VASRRGHRVKGRDTAPLISNATVNRSTTKVLQRLFTFAKGEGAAFEREPKWGELLLPEPVERVRELKDHEADAIDAAMRDDYGAFFAFVRASGLRLRECVTLKWSEVNFGTRQIIRIGKGGRRVTFPITDTIREILFPLQGQHPDFVFKSFVLIGSAPRRRQERPQVDADRRAVAMVQDQRVPLRLKFAGRDRRAVRAAFATIAFRSNWSPFSLEAKRLPIIAWACTGIVAARDKAPTIKRDNV